MYQGMNNSRIMKENINTKIKKYQIKNYQIILIEIIILIAISFIINCKYITGVSQCYIFQSTGILCPSCGGTRCIQSLLQGDIVSAFHYNFVIACVVIYLVVFNIVYLINRNKDADRKILTWIYPKYWYTIILAVILIIYTVLRNL